MVQMRLARFVKARKLLNGGTSYHWLVPKYWREQGCPLESRKLGNNLSQAELDAAADVWNNRFDAWRREVTTGEPVDLPTIPGTVAWLFREYLRQPAFHKRVGEISRRDYHNIYEMIIALPTVKGAEKTVGELPIKRINPESADKLYARFSDGGKYRRAEKAVSYCRVAWRIMRRLYPQYFRTDIPNPWQDFTVERRVRKVKPAVDREMVYRFADGVADKRPELAVAAVICFEWLQRPMNVITHMTWADYRPLKNPTQIRVLHHKTGAVVFHPLEDQGGSLFYAEAEAIIAKLPKRGVQMILGPDGQRYKATRFAALVRKEADRIGLPKIFSLDACRHGGMTELEEAAMTEGQGMALSGHKTPSAYRGYAKRTDDRVMAATQRRMAYRKASVA